MTTDGAATPDLPLTVEDIAAYKAIAAHEGQAATDRLVRLGLVVESPYEPGLPIALDPRDALQKLLEMQYTNLSAAVEQMRLLPQLEALRAAYDPERMYGGASSELLQTMTQMDRRIGEASSRATDEILSAQPIPRRERDPQSLRTGADRSLTLLERGVGIRLLYGPAAIADADSRAYIESFSAAGGRVKIHRKPFLRTVIVDSTAAFVDDYVSGGPKSVAAGWHISDRAAVAYARRAFMHLWDSSCTWREAVAWGTTLPTERQLQILGDMDAGYSQRAIAHRLGISSSQITADLAEARRTLGKHSTYALMSWYGRWMASQ